MEQIQVPITSNHLGQVRALTSFAAEQAGIAHELSLRLDAAREEIAALKAKLEEKENKS